MIVVLKQKVKQEEIDKLTKQIESKGLNEGAVEVAPLASGVPTDVVNRFNDLVTKLKNGEITVESAFNITDDQFNAYVSSVQ